MTPHTRLLRGVQFGLHLLRLESGQLQIAGDLAQALFGERGQR
jgi:hypothetical protein